MASSQSSSAQADTFVGRILQRIVDIRPGEARALFWSWLYVFALFLAYYVLRPIRDELGVTGGVSNLPWLFTGTLLALLAVNPLFAYVVRRWPRERFISITHRFFMSCFIQSPPPSCIFNRRLSRKRISKIAPSAPLSSQTSTFG